MIDGVQATRHMHFFAGRLFSVIGDEYVRSAIGILSESVKQVIQIRHWSADVVPIDDPRYTDQVAYFYLEVTSSHQPIQFLLAVGVETIDGESLAAPTDEKVVQFATVTASSRRKY